MSFYLDFRTVYLQIFRTISAAYANKKSTFFISDIYREKVVLHNVPTHMQDVSFIGSNQ